jgi:hypothetical protein
VKLANNNSRPVGNATTATGNLSTFNLSTINTRPFFRLVIQP